MSNAVTHAFSCGLADDAAAAAAGEVVISNWNAQHTFAGATANGQFLIAASGETTGVVWTGGLTYATPNLSLASGTLRLPAASLTAPSGTFTDDLERGLYLETNSVGVAGGLTVTGPVTVTALATPGSITVTNIGTPGATTYTYKLVATVGGQTTEAGAASSTATGNATLDGTNFNRNIWAAVPGATGYRLYRTVGGPTQGLIATPALGATVTVDDTGLAGGGETAPTVNDTGLLTSPRVSVLGRAAIGPATGGPASDHMLYVYEISADTSGTRIGAGGYLSPTPTLGVSSANAYGLVGELLAGGTQNHTGTLAGSFIKGQYNGDATVSLLSGMRVETKNLTGTGTITSARGIDAYVYTTTATITSGYGFYLNSPAVYGTGSIGTYYHLYLATPSAASTNYSIYSAGGANYLGGSLTVGGVAGTLAVNNEYTDSGNYSRLDLSWGIASNVAGIRASAAGTGTARNLRIYYGNGTNIAMSVPVQATTSIIDLATQVVATAGQTPFVRIGSASSVNSTSGTAVGLSVIPQFIPTATSTLVGVGVQIAPTINYSAGTPGAGSYEALKIAVTETQNPTGNNYMARWSGGPAGTTDIYRWTNTGHHIVAQATTNLTPAASHGGQLGTSDIAIYRKADKLVVSYASGNVTNYLMMDLDGSTTVWEHSTATP